jgi:hypothetical protein
MKSCCPQDFLCYFVLMEFISFRSSNAKALKLFSITSYNGVHILCFKEPKSPQATVFNKTLNNSSKQLHIDGALEMDIPR